MHAWMKAELVNTAIAMPRSAVVALACTVRYRIDAECCHSVVAADEESKGAKLVRETSKQEPSLLK